MDDGIFLEADLLGRLVGGLRASGGAFLGSSVIDLRFRDEHRPDEEVIEFWDGPVRPEEIGVDSRAWARRKVHRGANLQHLRERLPRTRDRLYHVADIGGCVLYDTAKLRSVGGFRPLGDHGRRRVDPAVHDVGDAAPAPRPVRRRGSLSLGRLPADADRARAAVLATRPAGRPRRGDGLARAGRGLVTGALRATRAPVRHRGGRLVRHLGLVAGRLAADTSGRPGVRRLPPWRNGRMSRGPVVGLRLRMPALSVGRPLARTYGSVGPRCAPSRRPRVAAG